MKFTHTVNTPPRWRRTPQGVRGLKCIAHGVGVGYRPSHPARGAWIEIPLRSTSYDTSRRTPQGVRGLKSLPMYSSVHETGRTPQGVRGLKSTASRAARPPCCRTPQGVRGLKYHVLGGKFGHQGRTPQGVRGLKFRRLHCRPPLRRSHPARGAWIEIIHNKGRSPRSPVAPRKGCVD